MLDYSKFQKIIYVFVINALVEVAGEYLTIFTSPVIVGEFLFP